MSIYASSIDRSDNSILMLWDGERPSEEEFKAYAKRAYGVDGKVSDISIPSEFRGMKNPGTAIMTQIVGNNEK